MKSACATCSTRHWCDEQYLCLRRTISYDIDADRIYKQYDKTAQHYQLSLKNVNRDSATFLGVHVAEFILSKVFKNVEIMPPCNPGYDFICTRGMKIDVKSSCLSKMNTWQFHIDHNTTADYFLCIAFDTREDLNPLHLWLIPGEQINHQSKISVSPNTASKLYEYKLDINKTITCCAAMKS